MKKKVIIHSINTISTKEVVSGSEIDFTVATDVKDSNGKILIKAGTPASIQITFSKSRGMIGQSGEVTISDFHTTAVDGTFVPLSGSMSSKLDDKMVLSVCLGLLICPLFLLIKGEDAQVQAGTTKTVYTISDTYINAIVI